MGAVELTPCLRSVAELVPWGTRFTGVGTDRAYLPVWLLQQGRATGAVASDLRLGSLEWTRGTAEEYDLIGWMDSRSCSGLFGVQSDKVNTIAMAGMGSEIIAAILTAAPWTWERECLFLLQPTSVQPFLRHWPQAHDYTIRRELLNWGGDTLYTTFGVYTGPIVKPALAELWTGRQARGKGSPLRLAYLDWLLRQTERAIAGLKWSKRPGDAFRLAELEQVHQGLLDMKGEWLSQQR